MMRTIAFSAIKGGVGKSSLAILTANFLAASGKKVLVIDADPQNSLSFYYNPDSADTRESLANVLIKDGKISENVVESSVKNIWLVPSAFELLRCKDCDEVTLMVALKEADEDGYDYCIIDTAPTFDNVIINCINAANCVVTPVQLGTFDYKSVVFYSGLINDLDSSFKWRIVFNKFKPIKTGTSIAAMFLQNYNQIFEDEILKSRIPESAAIKQYFDVGSRITRSKQKLATFVAIKAFVEEVAGEELSTEAF